MLTLLGWVAIATSTLSTTTIQGIISSSSLAYNQNSKVISAVLNCESGFDPFAYNPKDPGGSYGIAQFGTSTFYHFAPQIGIKNPDVWNPEQEIDTMAYMFSLGEKTRRRWTCYRDLPIGTSG